MTEFCQTLLTMTAAATVAALIVMALRFLLKKAPRWVTCALWLVVLCAIVGALFMGWRASNSMTTYTATSKLFIVDTSSGSINISNLQLGTVLTLDYQEVFKTWEVHEMVIEELDLPYTYEQMQSMLFISNHQAQICKLGGIGQQRMGADDQVDFPGFQCASNKLFLFRRHRTGEQGGTQPKRSKEF